MGARLSEEAGHGNSSSSVADGRVYESTEDKVF